MKPGGEPFVIISIIILWTLLIGSYLQERKIKMKAKHIILVVTLTIITFLVIACKPQSHNATDPGPDVVEKFPEPDSIKEGYPDFPYPFYITPEKP